MAISKAQQKAVHNYVKKNYDRIEFTAPKGSKEYLQTVAAENGESVNAYVIGAINSRLRSEGRSELPEKPAVSEIVERDKSGAVKPVQSGAGQKPENDIALPQTAISSNATAEQLIQLTKKRKSGKEDKSE